MREISVSPSRSPWLLAAGVSLLLGLILGGGLCKALWPTEVVREVPVVSYVDKRVEVPVEVIKYVDRVVEKRVEVPVIKEVVRVLEVPVEAKPAPVVEGPTPYELEDWGKLRRNMSRETVRVLLGNPTRVSGGSPEMWFFPFGGTVMFTYEGKLESWQLPAAAKR
jgi:hypothetical protein